MSGSASQRLLSAEELARRTNELLESDVPGGIAHDADALQGLSVAETAMESEAEINDGMDELAGGQAVGVHGSDLEIPDADESHTEGGAAALSDSALAALEAAAAGAPRSFDAFAPEAESEVDAPKKDDGPMRRADGSIIARKHNQKPFTRSNAKYLCGACDTRFFTKTDAEDCFAAHPLVDTLV